jgi:hypothetical protein
MAKPILVVAFPISVEIEDMSKAIMPIDQRLRDYHVIAYKATNVNDLDFKVLNAENSDDLNIEELKKEINEKIFKQ